MKDDTKNLVIGYVIMFTALFLFINNGLIFNYTVPVFATTLSALGILFIWKRR